ncbi:MAG: glycosyltransferase family 4 protein [Opitutales bacterium]|nr:glycosyltransferase family 4 protein [Opitutales bacterium]
MAVEGVNFIFHTIARAGGMERAVTDMICGFARKGLKVRGIAMRTDISVFPQELRDKIELVRVPARFPLCLFQRWANLDFENRAGAFCQKGWPVFSASRVTSPVDVAISGGSHWAHLQKKGRRPSFVDKKVIAHEREFYARAGVCVAHSQLTREEILELGVPAQKVVCLFPPVDVRKFNLGARENRERERAAWGVPADKCVLLFPSNNHSIKGADLILGALDAIDDPALLLAVASRRPIEHPRVLNLGFRTDVENCYAAADATILASRYEAFGLVAVESILCGTPALLSEYCGAKDALRAPGCFVFPRTPEGVKAAILSARERWRAGTLAVAEPQASIAYPYSLDRHIDALLELALNPPRN